MKNNIKLATILSTLVTGSVAVTALTLPDFNSVGSYLFRHVNWSESFYSKEQAIKYMTEQLELDNIFVQETTDSRVVNDYLVEASLKQVNDYFTLNPINPEAFDDNSASAEDQYNAIVQQFMQNITANLAKAIATSANLSSVYVPTSSISSDGIFQSTDWTHLTGEFYRGLNDTSYTTAAEAFDSLIDDTQIQLEYNGSVYTSITGIIDAWMTNEGFEGNTAYEEVKEFASWKASVTITNSDGTQRTITNTSVDSSMDMNTFKEYTKNAFYTELRAAEEANISSWAPNQDEWELTQVYDDSLSDWGKDNQVLVQEYMNEDLIYKNMSDVFGYVEPILSDGGGITHPYDSFHFTNEVEDFMPSWTNSRSGNTPLNFWAMDSNHQYDNMVDLEQKLTDTNDIGMISLLAFHGPDLNGISIANSVVENNLEKTISNFCSPLGDENKESDDWKSWTNYAEFMGFDNIEIPVEDRPDYSGHPGDNTNEHWWEPNCGSWGNKGLSLFGTYKTKLDWFNDWFLSTLGTQINTNHHLLNFFLLDGINEQEFFTKVSDPFTIKSTSGDPLITGKTLMDALLMEPIYRDGNESEYENSDSIFKRDYENWYNNQDYSFTWMNNDYKAKDKDLALASLEKAIEGYYDDQFNLGTYDMIQTTHYKYSDAHYNVLKLLDPSIVANNFKNIEYARDLARATISTYGKSHDVWTESGVVVILDDAHYKFDTTKVYQSVEEAMNDVNWAKTFDSIRTDASATGDFSDLVEYTNYTIKKLDNFNNSGEDILFNISEDSFAEKLINGYDMSEINSAIQNIKVEIDSLEDAKTGNTTTYETQKISIIFDNVNESKTYWVTTTEYNTVNLIDKLAAIDAARQELVKYWEKEIK